MLAVFICDMYECPVLFLYFCIGPQCGQGSFRYLADLTLVPSLGISGHSELWFFMQCSVQVVFP